MFFLVSVVAQPSHRSIDARGGGRNGRAPKPRAGFAAAPPQHPSWSIAQTLVAVFCFRRGKQESLAGPPNPPERPTHHQLLLLPLSEKATMGGKPHQERRRAKWLEMQKGEKYICLPCVSERGCWRRGNGQERGGRVSLVRRPPFRCSGAGSSFFQWLREISAPPHHCQRNRNWLGRGPLPRRPS